MLLSSDYNLVRPLVPSHTVSGHMAFVHAVLDGAMPGAVFVDDVRQPRSTVICNYSDFWFAVGAPNESFFAQVAATLVKETAAHSPKPELWATTPEIGAVLGRLFVQVKRRKEFHWRPEAARRERVALPAGMELRPLEAGLVTRIEGHMDPWIGEIFGGPEELVARSFGWFVVRDGEPVSMCMACAIGGGEAEIEIGTDERYRRQGLAVAAAHAFIEECERRGLLPAWTCDATNEASARLAERLGFVEFRQVTGHMIRPGMTLQNGRWVLPPGAQ